MYRHFWANVSHEIRTPINTGIGIREEDLASLYKSFQRLEPDKNRHIEGSIFMVNIPQKVVDDTPMGRLEQQQKYIEQTDKEQERLYAPDAKILAVDDNEMNLKVLKGII